MVHFSSRVLYYFKLFRRKGRKEHMDTEQEFQDALTRLVWKNGQFPMAAYQFVNGAVAYTVRECRRTARTGAARHVTGAELVRGIAEYAVMSFGFLAPDVFEFWHFRAGRDVGSAVYAMIAAGVLSASPNDRIEDFDIEPDLPGLLRSILQSAGS